MTVSTMVLLGVIALVLVSIIAIYNGIISGKNACKRAWADVITYSQQKMKILPKLEEKLKDYKDFESSTLKEIVALRSQVSSLDKDNTTPKDIESLEKQFKSMMSSLKINVEAYPELKSSDLYSQVMTEITEQQENVSASIVIYNRNVESFNNGIQMFPSSLVNSMLNKEKKLESFNNKEAENDVGFKPNL